MTKTMGTLLSPSSSSSSWSSTCLENPVSSRCTRNLASLMNNIFRAFTCRHRLPHADPPFLFPSTDLSPSPFRSQNAFLSPHVFMVYPRERGDVLPTIRMGFSFLASPIRPVWRLLSVDFSVSFSFFVSRCRFFHRSAPRGSYESFNSIFPDSTLRTSHATWHDALSFEIHLFGSTLDPIPFSSYYKIIPNTYNLDWCIPTICYLSQKVEISAYVICVS